jgi:stringent starvation protein B
MSNSHPLPPKKEVALALLERSNDRGIFVHLDPRQSAVVVPPWFKKQPQLVLQIGLNMPVPIPDLRLDDEGMSCTLSFNRSPFFCVVPWASVFAMVGEDGRGMVWPDDVPAEVPLSRQTQNQDRAGERGPERPAPPSMRALDGAKRDAKPASSRRGEDAEGEGAAKAKRPRKRPPLAAVPDGEGKAGSAGGGAAAGGNGGAKKKAPRADRTQPASARPLGGQPLGVAQKRGGSGAGKPAAVPSRGKKRELPPYLRVVK